jgi:hypothetical protein
MNAHRQGEREGRERKVKRSFQMILMMSGGVLVVMACGRGKI